MVTDNDVGANRSRIGSHWWY